MVVVLDTSFIWAFQAPRTEQHREARRFLPQLLGGRHGRLLATDLVYAECNALAAVKGVLPDDVLAMDEFFFGEHRVCDVVRCDPRMFHEALARTRTHARRGLTLADWTSVILAERHRARGIATFDDALGRAFGPRRP